MDSKIYDFFKYYDEKVKNDNKLKEVGDDFFAKQYIDRISFCVGVIKHCGIAFTGGYLPTIMLDEEDLQYFKNKYFNRLKNEMDSNVSEQKSKYEPLLKNEK